jgi:hypothetical protein
MKIIKSETKIEIIVPPNREWKNTFVFGGSIIFTIPLSIFFIYIFIKCLINWNFKPITFEYFTGIVGAVIFLNYSFWILIGKEKVIFTENTMEYITTNGIFYIKKTIETSRIKNLTVVEKVYNSDLPFIRDSGRIKFEYKGKYFSVLRGLKDNEIKEVTEIFQVQINKKTSHNSGLARLGF